MVMGGCWWLLVCGLAVAGGLELVGDLAVSGREVAHLEAAGLGGRDVREVVWMWRSEQRGPSSSWRSRPGPSSFPH